MQVLEWNPLKCRGDVSVLYHFRPATSIPAVVKETAKSLYQERWELLYDTENTSFGPVPSWSHTSQLRLRSFSTASIVGWSAGTRIVAENKEDVKKSVTLRITSFFINPKPDNLCFGQNLRTLNRGQLAKICMSRLCFRAISVALKDFIYISKYIAR